MNKAIAFFLLLTAPSILFATICPTKVISTHVGSIGDVFVRPDFTGGDGHLLICNLETVKNVPISVCKAWLTILESAIATGKQIDLSYPDNITCGILKDEKYHYDKAPALNYILLHDQ